MNRNTTISILLTTVALLCGPSIQAAKNVVIAGDMSCAGSIDKTLLPVENSTSRHCYIHSSGLFASPGQTVSDTYTEYAYSIDDKYGAQTVVPSLHNVLASAIGEDLVFTIVASDKELTRWDSSDIDFLKKLNPDYLVWMHGAKDAEKGVAADVYSTALTALLKDFANVPTVLVQPSNSGRIYASRPVNDEYTMPSHEIENVVYSVGRQLNKPVVPTYALDFCNDGITPRASSMNTLGKFIGQAFVAPEKSRFESNISEVTPFSLSVKINTVDNSQPVSEKNFVLPASNHGFEVWRTVGGEAQRLNISSVTRNDGVFTISTNERIVAGDVLVYGCTAWGVGKQDGTRGTLGSDIPLPLFSLAVTEVKTSGDNLSGRVTCDGQGVGGVTVSDGYEFATTDVDGYYSMFSNKKLGYVFYTLPSGYEPETEANGWQVKIHSLLSSRDAGVAEVHDFKLKKVDNKAHILIVGADSHLAARNQDKSQFKSGFMASVKAFVKAHPDANIYSTILGDMSWDQYWYANDYALPDFCETMTTQGYPVKLFPVMGNHDNDGATPAGADCDFKAAEPFRAVMAPTFYSYNLGAVHYVVLDDVVYKNTYTAGKSYSEGIVGDRDYGRYYTDEQLEWLRHDLSLITDKSTPVVVCFHVQNWALSTNGSFTVSANLDNGASEKLANLLSDFSDVHLLSGHTHYNFHAHPPKYPNIHENNVAGICATWWWTGKLVDRHICKDGSPGGYAVYTADGKNLSWRYQSVDGDDDENAQFRIYDMNAVKNAYSTDADIKKWLNYDKTQTNYSSVADNLVYVNVFNYDTDWKVEIFEGETPLTVKRITAQDPLHVICYEVPRYKAASTVTADFVTNKTNHMFSAQASGADKPITVKVTDGFGRIFTKTVSRPGTFDTNLR